MSEETLAKDVAKVLRGTHTIRTLEIPENEYDLIQRILEDGKPLEDASPQSALVRRKVRFDGNFSVSVELNNPDEDEIPFLQFILLYSSKEEKIDDIYWEKQHFTKEIPETVIFSNEGDDGKKLMIRVRRGKSS